MADWHFERIGGEYSFTEGPQWTGELVLFTDMYNHRIISFDPATGQVARYFQGTNLTNGLLYSSGGDLYCCEVAARCLSRLRDGRREVLAESFGGDRLNSPNDVTEDSKGRIWFTDPRYGEHRADMELDHESVYRLDPGSGTLTRATFDTTRPNGLLFSADEKTLYVVQSDYGEGAARELRAYPVGEDGSLGPFRMLHNFFPSRGADGLTLTSDGHVMAAAGWSVNGPGPMIYVFDSSGRVLETQPTPPGFPTNLCFGGADLGDLYVTMGEAGVFRVRNCGYRGHDRYRR